MRGFKVYEAANPPQAEILKDFLGGHGIDAEVRDQHLWGGVGELPADSYPSIWVFSPADAQTARKLIRDFETGRTASQPGWQCRRCGEHLEGQFTRCWHCGQARPRDPD